MAVGAHAAVCRPATAAAPALDRGARQPSTRTVSTCINEVVGNRVDD
jgi:hypothetical protein